MPANRLDILKGMVERNPADNFARYGLAMEYAKLGEFEQAVAHFDALLAVNPNYLAAYFHTAQTLEKLGRAEAAREMYARGIEVAERLGDQHTRSELQAALDLLG